MTSNTLTEIRKKGRIRRYIMRFAGSVVDPLTKINLKKLQSVESRTPEEDERSYYNRLQTLAKEGPIFSGKVIQSVESLPDRYLPNVKKPFIIWLANRLNAGDTLANHMVLEKPDEVWTNIRDFLNAEGNLNFKDFSGLLEAANRWHEDIAVNSDDSISITGDQVVYTFDNGYKIVKVKPENLALEGESMGHCVGGYCDAVQFGDTEIYSLRSKDDRPLVTIEIEQGMLRQIKGRQNKTPAEKYRKYIIEWLDSLKESVNLHSSDYFKILSDEQIVTLLEKDPETFIQHEEAARSIQSRKIKDPRIKSLLEDLAKSGEKKNIEFVARNINTPVNILKELARDCLLRPLKMESVALSITENKGVTADILHMLASHPESSVKLAVARNPMTSQQTLHNFSTDADITIQRVIAERGGLSPEIIENLAQSFDTLVLESLAVRADLPYMIQLKLFDQADRNIWLILARNPYISPNILEKLAKNKEVIVRMTVAENPAATSEVLDILATDDSISVRERVARHPNCSGEALERFLTTNDSGYAGMAAIRNPSLTPEIILSILSKANLDEMRIFLNNLAHLDHDLPRWVYEEMSKHKNIHVRMFVAEHAYTPAAILQSMKKNDPDAGVRYVADSYLRLRYRPD